MADGARRRGFDKPLSMNQLVSWIGNAIATGGFYALCATILLSRVGCQESTVAAAASEQAYDSARGQSTQVAGLLLPHLALARTGAVVPLPLNPTMIQVVGGFCCWVFLETHVPTKECALPTHHKPRSTTSSLPRSWFGKLLPDSERWTKNRYCREHKDVVVGLDHFCTRVPEQSASIS